MHDPYIGSYTDCRVIRIIRLLHGLVDDYAPASEIRAHVRDCLAIPAVSPVGAHMLFLHIVVPISSDR